MSANLSAKGLRVSGLTLWVLTVFIGAQFVAAWLLVGLAYLWPTIAGLNIAVLTTVSAALSYVLAIGVMLAVQRVRDQGKEGWGVFGLTRGMAWSDIGIGLLSILPYYVVSYAVVAALSGVFQFIDPTQTQDIPYQNLVQRYEYIVSFIALVVLAPVAEELLFRGYFLGKMSKTINRWVAVFITALIFGLLHLPGATTDSGITLQWAVAVDTFALGLVLGALRIWTGSVWAGILLHMLKNSIAYFILFVYPNLAGTM